MTKELLASIRKSSIAIPAFAISLALLIRGAALLVAFHYHSDAEILSLTPDSQNYVSGALALFRDGLLSHRSDLFYFPAGYPLFLGVVFLFFGTHAWIVVLLQGVLAAATCGMVFSIALALGLQRRVAALATLLGAVSPTSIALSGLILSDTLYAFLFAASLRLFIGAASTGRLWWYGLCGITCGTAMLVRPVGKFWPFVLLILAIALVLVRKRESAGPEASLFKAVRGGFLMLLLACLIPLPWVIRNQVVHGFPVLAITTISARSTVAAKAVADMSGRDYRAVQVEWEQEYLSAHPGESLMLEGLCRQALRKTHEVESTYPLRVLKAYAAWSWENVNESDYLLPALIPPTEKPTSALNDFLHRSGFIRAPLYFSLAGLILLLWGRRFQVVLILGCTYGYCACTIGAFPYQGSRYFLPGQIPGWILVSCSLIFAYDVARFLLQRRLANSR